MLGHSKIIGSKRFIIGIIAKVNNVIYFLNDSFFYIIKKSIKFIDFKYSHGPPYWYLEIINKIQK